MLKIKHIVLLSSLSVAPTLLAGEALPCGTAGAYVSVGESQQDVLNECGQPTSINQSQETRTTGKTVRWYYAANLLEGTNESPIIAASQSARYIVEFVDGKVNHIYSDDQIYDEYTFCGPVPQSRGEVDRGDSMDKVRANCGDPTFTNVMSEGQAQARVQITEYIYQFDPTVPALVVTLENGIVTQLR